MQCQVNTERYSLRASPIAILSRQSHQYGDKLLQQHENRPLAMLDLPSLRPSLSSRASSLLESKERSLKVSPRRTPNHSNAPSKPPKPTYPKTTLTLTRRCKLAENSFVSLYTSIYDCRDPASALQEALDVIEARDKQVDNLLRGMEELNTEIEGITEEKAGLKQELEEVKADYVGW